MEIELEINRLERSIQDLQIRFRRFLAGDPEVARPPIEVEEQIDLHLRRLRNVKMRRSVDRFRLGNLEARYNSYREMYGRQIRAREEGRVPDRRSGGLQIPKHDPELGIVVGGRGSDAGTQALFEGLYSRTGRAMKMDLDTFRSYLGKQVESIQAKTGCESVQFRLVNEGGKVKLKAKPVGGKKASR